MQKKRTIKSPPKHPVVPLSLEQHFTEVASIISEGRSRAYQTVNAVLIETYWRVGRYINQKLAASEWGDKVVSQLAAFLQKSLPDPRGFSDKNLWRMKQFHDLYGEDEILSPLVRQLGWTHNMIILSRTKSREEREFYIRLAIREHYSKRELEHQITSCLYERTAASPPKLSTVLTQIHPAAETLFRDSYTLDFLGLPSGHSEYDLRKGIVGSLKHFLIEFGRDFAFVGEEYRLQVGMQDFFVDLLFYHRELQCLVAFELKVDDFKPEYLGKLSFYLEALDRDVKKPHEKPSIGIILCKGKDAEVVEYALARTTSPAAIAEYVTKLPDKKLLQSKLHEFFDNSVREIQAEYTPS